MKLRLRRMEGEELEQARYDGMPLVILHDTSHRTLTTYAVLEFKGCAEGSEWTLVPVE
jgi:hypothetical protein